jgi:hypothetical protein
MGALLWLGYAGEVPLLCSGVWLLLLQVEVEKR